MALNAPTTYRLWVNMDGSNLLFELELVLPNKELSQQALRLIGFEKRYDRIRRLLRLLVDPVGLEQWAKKHFGKRLPLLDAMLDRYPLVIFEGDVGTGKTATAEAIANSLSQEMQKEAMLFKLSTRVRGSGNVSEMSTLINQAFEVITKEAGKSRASFLVIDEADSLAANRNASHSHHEDKVAVNTLIQKIDDIRRLNGRVLVLLCTNRISALDPAILRRAAHIEKFLRPDLNERTELLEKDLNGVGLTSSDIDELVRLTGPDGSRKLGYTFSDIRTRVLPDAIARAFPDRKLEHADIVAAIRETLPSPTIVEE